MQNYRVYWFDGDSHIEEAEWIEAADDEAAVAALNEKQGARRWELWRGTARIAVRD